MPGTVEIASRLATRSMPSDFQCQRSIPCFFVANESSDLVDRSYALPRRLPMDLRGYMAMMVEEGLVTKIEDPVDWNLKAGAIMRYAAGRRSPAPWLMNVKDSMKGSSLLGSLFATYERLSVIFGLPRDTGYHDLVNFYEENFVKRLKTV